MKDFLDEQIESRTAANPAFPTLLEAAVERREVARLLAAARAQAGKTQKEVALEIGTSQSQVARIENGHGDVKLATLVNFAAAVGVELMISAKQIVRPRRGKPALAGTRH